MSKQTITQSQKRFQESLSSLFMNKDDFSSSEHSLIFMKSSTDEGIIRNGGRNGARFAPQSLLNAFKRLNQNEVTTKYRFAEVEVSSPSEETKDFLNAQEIESKAIKELVTKFKKSWICHIGGGHDHVYPLLMAFADSFQKIVVINIDAHADTRMDETSHSGTPFRQFDKEYQGQFFLYQIGLHPYANSKTTLTPLQKGKMEILWRAEIEDGERLKSYFKSIEAQVDDKTLVVFSIDADALLGSEVPGVSAVNHDGISRNQLLLLWNEYLKLKVKHAPIMGIYELNPIYDTLSALSMRTISSFLYESLR